MIGAGAIGEAPIAGRTETESPAPVWFDQLIQDPDSDRVYVLRLYPYQDTGVSP